MERMAVSRLINGVRKEVDLNYYDEVEFSIPIVSSESEDEYEIENVEIPDSPESPEPENIPEKVSPFRSRSITVKDIVENLRGNSKPKQVECCEHMRMTNQEETFDEERVCRKTRVSNLPEIDDLKFVDFHSYDKHLRFMPEEDFMKNLTGKSTPEQMKYCEEMNIIKQEKTEEANCKLTKIRNNGSTDDNFYGDLPRLIPIEEVWKDLREKRIPDPIKFFEQIENVRPEQKKLFVEMKNPRKRKAFQLPTTREGVNILNSPEYCNGGTSKDGDFKVSKLKSKPENSSVAEGQTNTVKRNSQRNVTILQHIKLTAGCEHENCNHYTDISTVRGASTNRI